MLSTLMYLFKSAFHEGKVFLQTDLATLFPVNQKVHYFAGIVVEPLGGCLSTNQKVPACRNVRGSMCLSGLSVKPTWKQKNNKLKIDRKFKNN